jgi:hypothetical protein
MKRKPLHILCCAAAALALLTGGCGSQPLTPQEAQKAILDLLAFKNLARGVTINRLLAVRIQQILDADEALATPELETNFRLRSIVEKNRSDQLDIYFVITNIEAYAEVAADNAMKAAASTNTKVKGGALYMVTRDRQGQVTAALIEKQEGKEQPATAAPAAGGPATRRAP